MKTMSIILTSILLLSLGFVVAEQSDNAAGDAEPQLISAGSSDNGNGSIDGETVKTMNQLNAGTYNAGEGKQIQVQAGENNRVRLRVGDSEAQTGLELSSDGQKVMAKMSNGRNAEVKVMPDTASEKALERLRLKNCNETRNCSIELKQVGQGTEAKLAYEIQIERHSRVLGLFQAKMQVRAQVDAENGEVISTGKPWWAFLATEPIEE